MNHNTISAVIITKNEENNIINCLESIDFVDEIIVIDDFSSDRTQEVIKNYKKSKIKLLKRKLDTFSSQRNYGLQKSSSKWTLFVDADETVTEKLQEEIKNKITSSSNQEVNGYYLKRTDVMWGKSIKHGESANIKIIRLAKTKSGKWKQDVHETWDVKGKKETLNSHLVHHPHQSIREFVKEVDFYSTLRANELSKTKNSVSVFSVVGYPLAKFVFNFFYKQGYKDGVEGFLIAAMMSLHSFLVRAKLWQIVRNEKVT